MTTAYEEMRAAKELLDQGALTQEEFDAKKAQLLAADEPAPAATDEKAPQKRKTGLIVGIVVAVAAALAVAAFAVSSLLPDSRDEYVVGTWSGYFFTVDSEPQTLSSSTRLIVRSDHTLTFGGGGIDTMEGTWHFDKSQPNEEALFCEVTLDDMDPITMLILDYQTNPVLSLNFDTDFSVYFKR